jgi:hypothetical protein
MNKDYYKQLAEIREFDIDTILKPSVELLEASSIIYHMLLELDSYATKIGNDKKYKASLERLLKLDEVITKFSNINDHCYQLRTLLKDSMVERDKLMQENELLKNQIENFAKNWEEL